jgi:hypothetical protein
MGNAMVLLGVILIDPMGLGPYNRLRLNRPVRDPSQSRVTEERKACSDAESYPWNWFFRPEPGRPE